MTKLCLILKDFIMTNSRYISKKDNDLLFARSAGRCNLCQKEVPDIAERAHIIAYSEYGARGDTSMERDNSYENLILLCPNCHTQVDKYPEQFPSTKLHSIKEEHEKNISNRLSSPSPQRQNDIHCINKLISWGNICNIPDYVDCLPESVNIKVLDFCNVLNYLENQPSIYPLNDNTLQYHLNNFIDAFNDLWPWICESTPDSSKNFSHQHFSQAEGNPPFMKRLYEGISDERNQEIDRKINENVHKLLKKHNDLIQYIRTSYPEINFRQNCRA